MCRIKLKQTCAIDWTRGLLLESVEKDRREEVLTDSVADDSVLSIHCLHIQDDNSPSSLSSFSSLRPSFILLDVFLLSGVSQPFISNILSSQLVPKPSCLSTLIPSAVTPLFTFLLFYYSFFIPQYHLVEPSNVPDKQGHKPHP